MITFIQFQQGIKEHFAYLTNLLTKKGQNYAGDTDPLYNFRQSAKDSGITTIQSIHNQYNIKHTRLANLLGRGSVSNFESVTDTIDDAIGYLAILKQAIEEERVVDLTEKTLNHKIKH